MSSKDDKAVGQEPEYDVEVDEDGNRYISFGPVWNPDGTPTEMTKGMLAGTGRLAEWGGEDK